MASEIKLVSVECDHCGAPLEISESTRFVTCAHCNSRLAVHDTGSARFTEVMENMAEDLSTIRLQNELEQLDREWMMRKDSLMVNGQEGGRTLPTRVGGVIALIVGGGFILFWIGMATTMGAPAIFPLFGIVMLGMVIFGAIHSISKAGDLDRSRSEYESRWKKLLDRLNPPRQKR